MQQGKLSGEEYTLDQVCMNTKNCVHILFYTLHFCTLCAAGVSLVVGRAAAVSFGDKTAWQHQQQQRGQTWLGVCSRASSVARGTCVCVIGSSSSSVYSKLAAAAALWWVSLKQA